MCGTMFYGRADARYCCGACRQKAYRAAAAGRAVDQMVPAPQLASAVAQALEVRQQARAARESASKVRQRAAAMRGASAAARASRGAWPP